MRELTQALSVSHPDTYKLVTWSDRVCSAYSAYTCQYHCQELNPRSLTDTILLPPPRSTEVIWGTVERLHSIS